MATSTESTRPLRPRPQYNADQAFFWEGLLARELRIQRFPDDGSLWMPPAQANPNTGSMTWDWIVASGRGRLYSHTVCHHPQFPAFDYPLIVGLVELEEGVRLVSNIIGCDPADLAIGMALEVDFVDIGEGSMLHQFRPVKEV